MLLGNVAPKSFPWSVLEHSTTGLLLFVKSPEPGKVKTRLGQSIGLKHASQLYRRFGLDFRERLRCLNLPILIFFAPDDAEQAIRDWLGNNHLYPQGDGTLGDRMQRAFETGFNLGFKHLMIFGSDSPDLPLPIIEQGIQSLHSDRVVVGPSNDGGYYTIGFSQKSWTPQVFRDIPWSSEQVYPQTIAILHSNIRSSDILPKWEDIDTLVDLQNFYHRNLFTEDLPETMNYIECNLKPFLAEN